MSNNLISKSVQKRLAAQQSSLGDNTLCVEANDVGNYTPGNPNVLRQNLPKIFGSDPGNKDPIAQMAKEEINRVHELEDRIDHLNRRHEEDMGYIQHYRIRIAELEKALKDNNIEVP